MYSRDLGYLRDGDIGGREPLEEEGSGVAIEGLRPAGVWKVNLAPVCRTSEVRGIVPAHSWQIWWET
jgi:hypothetical protein